MSNVDFLRLKPDLERVEESLTERLARIEAEAKAPASADEATVAAVERMLARKRQEAEDGDIEDDFAGGTAGIDGSPWLMPWRSHLAELISRLREEGYARHAAHLARLADVNSLKEPFTAADETKVIKSIREYLTAFKKEVSGDGTPPDPADESQPPADNPTDVAGGMGWPEALAAAEEIRLAGKRFTSYRKMAEVIGCHLSVLHDAINDHGTVELQEWASKQHGASRLNASPNVAAVALEKTPQSREPDPSDVTEEGDIDRALGYLIEQAEKSSPEAVARLRKMPADERRLLATTAYSDPDTAEQIFRWSKRQKKRPRAD